MSGGSTIRTMLGTLLAAVVVLALLEGLLALWLRASWLPAPTLVRRLGDSEILYPQWDPACSRYDADFSYVLVPGSCRFRSREFDTEIRINSAGFRDGEASLEAPSVIAIGDSHTFGWGLAQDESYPQVLERRIGVPVLNTGVPSYATYREMRRLDEVDTSALTHLVVQYDTNDYVENKTFLKDDRVSPMSPERYDGLREERQRLMPYRPGKYTRLALDFAFGLKRRQPKASTEVAAFLNALERASSVDVSRLLILAFATGPGHQRFLDELRGAVAAPQSPDWVRRIRILDLEGEMTRDAYFRLDPHMRAETHKRIADKLAEAIGPKETPGEAE